MANDAPSQRLSELERAHGKRKTPRYSSLVLHWLRRAVTRPARPKAAPLPTVAPGRVSVTFAGHATVMLRYANLGIACDPMLGDWCGGVHREVKAGLSPGELSDIDLVLISHAARGHLHLPTLDSLPRSATLVTPPRTSHAVSELGFARVVELNVGQSLEYRGVDISATAARHGSGRRPAHSYVIRGDGPSIYYCAGSGYFSGFSEIGRRFQPDIALLPIGGYAPSSFRQRNMSPLDAVFAFEDLDARIMIPIRHGAFALSYELMHDPERWLAELVSKRNLEAHVVALEPGQSRLFELPSRKARSRTDSEEKPPEVDVDLDFGSEPDPDGSAPEDQSGSEPDLQVRAS